MLCEYMTSDQDTTRRWHSIKAPVLLLLCEESKRGCIPAVKASCVWFAVMTRRVNTSVGCSWVGCNDERRRESMFERSFFGEGL